MKITTKDGPLLLLKTDYCDFVVKKGVQTCPARVAATITAHWVTAIGVAAVAALTALQPIRTLLTTTIIIRKLALTLLKYSTMVQKI